VIDERGPCFDATKPADKGGDPGEQPRVHAEHARDRMCHRARGRVDQHGEPAHRPRRHHHPPLPPSFNKYVNLVLKTNLVTLLALRPDIPISTLTVYKGHSHGDGGLLERMVQLLAASPHGLLPFFKLCIDLGIATREDKWVWNRLKERALLD
jgi:hypothetical protein